MLEVANRDTQEIAHHWVMGGIPAKVRVLADVSHADRPAMRDESAEHAVEAR